MKLPLAVQQFASNVTSLSAVKAIDLLTTLLLVPYLVHQVGVNNFGYYAVAFAAYMYAINGISYSFNLSAVRALAVDSSHENRMNQFRQVFTIKVFLTLVSILIFLITFGYLPDNLILLYAWGLPILLTELFNVRWYFFGLQKMHIVAYAQLFATALYAAGIVFLIRQPDDYLYILPLQALAWFVVHFALFVYVKYSNGFVKLLCAPIYVTTYLRHHFNTFLILFIPSVFNSSAVFLVGQWGTAIDAAITQLGMRYTSAFSAVNDVLSNAFYPLINRLKRLRKYSLLTLLGVGVVLSAAMFFLASLLITFWLNNEALAVQKSVITLAQLLAFIPILLALVAAYGNNGLLLWHRDGQQAMAALWAALVGILSAYWLIPQFSYVGGGFALLLARGVYALGCVLSFYKKPLQ